MGKAFAVHLVLLLSHRLTVGVQHAAVVETVVIWTNEFTTDDEPINSKSINSRFLKLTSDIPELNHFQLHSIHHLTMMRHALIPLS